jgi:hypothetical protein
VQEDSDGRHEGSTAALGAGQPGDQLRTNGHSLPGGEQAGEALGQLPHPELSGLEPPPRENESSRQNLLGQREVL